jgi:hypothetical protein
MPHTVLFDYRVNTLFVATDLDEANIVVPNTGLILFSAHAMEEDISCLLGLRL